MLLGLAEHYSTGKKPEHDVYLVVSPGHEQEQDGPRHFVETHQDIVNRTRLAVSLEHVASTGIARSYRGQFQNVNDKYGNREDFFVPTNADSQQREVTMSNESPLLKRAWANAASRNGLASPANIWGPAAGPEPRPFTAAGVPVVTNVETNHWYHTSGDTPETISEESMERAFRFYTDFLSQLERTPSSEIKGDN